MHGWVRRLLVIGCAIAALAVPGALGIGCSTSNVGDPCTPESVPTKTGFDPTEAYIETSSVQCRTRVCLVQGLKGDPTKIEGTKSCYDGGPEPDGGVCVTQAEIDQSVYCSCRCAVPAGINAPTCKCPSGFTCKELVTLPQAGDGVKGSYCVKNQPPDAGTDAGP